MKTLVKTVLIVGLCGIGVVAAAHVVLGKARAHDAVHALQRMAQSEVDELIKRQNDMQEELAKLRAEYPRQIAMLRSQAAEVDRRIAELDREDARAKDITRLCEEDISYLEDQRTTIGAVYTDRVIEHRGSRYTPAEAETLIGRISETRGLYTGRMADINAERAVLAAEKEQIEGEVAELRAEQTEFEVEYASLLREIERLKRNEELLKIRERKGCESRHGETMSTLNDVKAAIERARIEQDERMKAARIKPRSLDYEARAKVLELNRKKDPKKEDSAH